MDKQTLSQYGWIVIAILVLSVMMALATPFGEFIASGIKSTYTGFGEVNDNALGIFGQTIKGPVEVKYYQPYTLEVDGRHQEFVFHKDGTVDAYSESLDQNDSFGQVFTQDMGEQAIYKDGTVEFLGVKFEISDDGSKLISMDENTPVTLTLKPTSIKPLYMNTEYVMQDGPDLKVIFLFREDGSGTFNVFYMGENVQSEEIPAGEFKYFDQYFEEHYYDEYNGQTYIDRYAIYPDGSKIILDGDVFVVSCTHPNTRIENQADNYTGDKVCVDCGTVVEKGKYAGELRFGLYQTGAIEKYENEGKDAVADMFIMSWEDLLANNVIEVVDGQVKHNAPEQPAPMMLLDAYDEEDCGLVGDLILPDDASITGIAESGFEDCNTLTGIYMQDNITNINDFAFYSCDNMNTIKLSNNLKIIGESALAAYGLTSIALPQGLNSIGARAFDWTQISSINIPKSVTFIGNGILSYCENIRNITVESGNTNYCVINGCLIDKAAKSIIGGTPTCTIPADSTIVTSIADGAFEGSSITTLIVPSNINKIGHSAFEDSSITTITLPNTITKIENDVFNRCYNIKSVGPVGSGAMLEIPNSVTEIGDHSFGSSGITSLSLPNSVTTIGSWTFAYCNSLITATIPDSVTQMGSDTFRECRKLQSVKLSSELTEIPSATFIFCYKLSEITIPEKVTTIGGSAFAYCYELKTMTIHKNIVEIDSGAFYNSKVATVIFEDTEGWGRTTSISGSNASAMDVTDAQKAAQYLRGDQYVYWFKQ